MINVSRSLDTNTSLSLTQFTHPHPIPSHPPCVSTFRGSKNMRGKIRHVERITYLPQACHLFDPDTSLLYLILGIVRPLPSGELHCTVLRET